MPSITVQAEGAEERFALEAAVVTIGRGLESDIRIKDIKASRRHCQVVKTPQGFKLVDLGSGNGTYLNGIQVKEQGLKTGDKIQIGQTVIVFENGMEQKKTGTAAMPKVGAARKGETARIATGQTKRTEAVKPTGPAPAAKKSPTGKMPAVGAPPKPGTARIEKKTTGRATTGTGRVPTSRATAGGGSGRMGAVPRKKNNPIILIAVGGGALALVLGVMAFAGVFKGSVNMDVVKRDLRAISDAAGKLEEAGQLDEAIAKLNEGIAYIEKNVPDLATDKASFKQRISDIETGKKADAEIVDRWTQWKAKFDKIGGEGGVDKLELMKDARNFVEVFATKPFYSDFTKAKEQLQRMIDTDAATTARQDYQVFINDLNARTKFADKEKTVCQWGTAIKELKEFMKKTTAADRPKAESKIGEIEGRAREGVDFFRKRAERMKADAEGDPYKWLQERMPQFAGTAVEEEFNKVVESFKP
jgi:hypothetical protein